MTLRNGHVEVICGPMFSGKTEELIRRLRRAVIGRRRVQVFKPAIDRRYHATRVTSHDATSLEALAVDDARALLNAVEHDAQVVGIDEAQFFGCDLVATVEALADRGVLVIVAGLDMDWRGEPFDPMPQLLAVAEHVTKLAAVCSVCGGEATRSHRLVAGEGRIVVGAACEYEARCRACCKGVARG